MRPVFNFTATGQLEPEMKTPPAVRVNIVKSPADATPHVAGARTGTTFDFPVSVRSTELGRPLAIGIYQIEYEAVAEGRADLSPQEAEDASSTL